MLTQLGVFNVRNISEAYLQRLQPVNLLIGANGAGKTSILEAIHLLATARSFRHNQVRPVVRHGQSSLLVTAKWRDGVGLSHQTGIERWLDGRVRIRCDGQQVATAAELASLLPVQVLNSEAFGLIEGAPALRRQFFDWGVFHVEHRFFRAWAGAQRALRQRNALLKHDRIDQSSWRLWTESYAEQGESVDALRQRHFGRLAEAFETTLSTLSPELSRRVSVSLQRGWNEGASLAAVLESDADIDQRRGFTRSGPHRADLRIRVGQLAAQDVLSRGQIKVVAAALKVAQGAMLLEGGGRRCLYLIDDLAAELDEDHRRRMARELTSQGAQVFVTALTARDLEGCWPDEQAKTMFHVEHGQVESLKDDPS